MMTMRMTFTEYIEKRPKSQAEAMLLQAIVALSVQPAYEHMNPGAIFDNLSTTCQQWDFVAA